MDLPRARSNGIGSHGTLAMAMKNTHRGFALLVAVIFMSVMLALGLALGSLGYKQVVLASSAVESQKAFYTADRALECGLYYDQQENLFAYPSIPPTDETAPKIYCAPSGVVPYSVHIVSDTPTVWVVRTRLSFGGGRCADVTVYKPKVTPGTTYIFSQGYDVPCATVENPNGARFVSRGLGVYYTSSAPIAGSCGSGGNTINEVAGDCIHTFTSDGTFDLPGGGTVE